MLINIDFELLLLVLSINFPLKFNGVVSVVNGVTLY